MRKTTIVLLTLLLVCSLLFVVASVQILRQQDQVAWEETILFGSSTGAEGLAVQTQNTMNDHLLWTTQAMLGQTPQTQYDYSIGKLKAEEVTSYTGLILTVDENFPWTSTYLKYLSPEVEQCYRSLANYCHYTARWLPAEDSMTFTVNLQDHFPYYPLDGRFDLPGAKDTTWHWQALTADPQAQAWNTFRNYFKIPILGEYTLLVEAHRDTNETLGGFAEASAFYYPEFHSVATEDTCYFTFNPVAEDGQIADCSQIPGGYGLYSFRYTLNEKGNAEVDLDSLTTAISLDPSERYHDMWLSEDNTRLHYMTTADHGVFLSVIDLQTMTCLQKLQLAAPTETQQTLLQQGDGFLVLFLRDPEDSSGDTVSVFAQTGSGTYDPVFTTALNTDSFNTAATLDAHGFACAMAFDGTRLALAQNFMELSEEGKPTHTGCDFFVAVYSAQGMTYAGHYDVSLTDIQIDSPSGLSYCEPFEGQPIFLHWTD